MKKSVFAFALALLTAASAWAQTFQSGDLYYYITDEAAKTVAVTYEYEWYESNNYSSLPGAVTIPETVSYNGINYSVTSIGERAFDYCSALTQVTIGDGVTSIGNSAFSSCSALTQVTIGDGVTSIGNSAFSGCSALTQITIPNSVTSIGDRAFSSCSALAQVTWNAINWADFTSSHYSPFYDSRSNITTFTFGSQVEHIPAYLCCGMDKLTQVTIPESVTSIGDGVFSSCSALTAINVEGSNTTYCSENGILFNKDKTTLVCYPAGKPETIYTIPESVTSIGDGVFSSCSALTAINVEGSNTTYCSENGILFNKDKTTLVCYPAGKPETIYTIPESVTSIGNSAFSSCSALTQVTIPESVTSIGDEAFYDCSALAFVRCEATTPPTLGSGCFGDTFLVFIPTGTKDAYTEAWGSSYTYAEGVVTVHVETPGGLTEAIMAEGYMPAAVNKLTVTGTLNETDFSIIKNNMTSLYDLDISGITNTTLPEAVFSGKTTLLQIDLPTQLTAIPDNAFHSCLITSITIPESITSIGDWAFSSCSALTQVTIPNSVTSIGDLAFAWCSALTQVNIGDGVTSIGGWAFSSCSALTQVNIPNSVTSIGERTFSDCSALTQVTIGNSVESIGNYAFQYCSALTSVIIGNHVETISYDAFGGCSSLDTITCLGSNPPAVSQSFETIDPKTCKLYVPQTALTDYIQAPVWGAFLNMEGIDVPTETYMLNLRIGQGGSIIHNGNVYTANSAIEVLPEATTTLQIQANPGYEIGSVSFNGTDYTAQVSEDGTLTLPALTENATLQVSFTQQSYTVAYYFVGSNGYFFTTVNYGETFRCHAAATEGHSILSVTLNGKDITYQLGKDGLLEITNITEDCTLIISTDGEQTSENTGTQQDAAAFRAWQSNGEVFVEHTQDMTGVALYDVTGRLLHQTATVGYGVLRMAAPGKIHIVRATYADGTTASQKVM